MLYMRKATNISIRELQQHWPQGRGYQASRSAQEIVIQYVALFLPFGCNKQRQMAAVVRNNLAARDSVSCGLHEPFSRLSVEPADEFVRSTLRMDVASAGIEVQAD
jgi:hypothetical protein